MICQFDHADNVWIAAGRGPMRPIVAEGTSMNEAMAGFYEEVENQKRDEYAMEQQMSHLAEINEPGYTPTSGYDYEQ